MSSRTEARTDRRYYDGLPTPESSTEIVIAETIEILEGDGSTMVFGADGFLRDSEGKSLHQRNAIILALALLAISLISGDIFGSTATIRSSPKLSGRPQHTGRLQYVADPYTPEEETPRVNEDPYGSSGGDSEKKNVVVLNAKNPKRDEKKNVVDLNAKNPKRDGVQFISPSCNYTCRTDRLPQESPLYAGQVLCNEKMRFGMTESNDLFIQDCQADVQTILWSAKEANLAADQLPVHFEMKKNGYFQIISDPSGKVVFESRPKSDVTYHELCLSHKPKLDCPYLHLHKDGVLVLNWIQEDPHKWKAENVQRRYVGLNP